MKTATKIETGTTTRRPPVLSAPELRRLLQAPNRRRRGGHADAALLAVLFGMGARVGEAVRLTRQDVEPGPRGTLVLTIRTLKTKSHPLRAVVLDRPFVRYLRDYLAADDPRWFLWPSRRSEAITVRCAQRRVMKYLAQIGRGSMRVHDARHTWITNLLRATNGNIFLAAKLAGHSDERQIVRTYGHLLLDDPIRAARAMAEYLGRPGPTVVA